jgi:hypothetical protein
MRVSEGQVESHQQRSVTLLSLTGSLDLYDDADHLLGNFYWEQLGELLRWYFQLLVQSLRHRLLEGVITREFDFVEDELISINTPQAVQHCTSF